MIRSTSAHLILTPCSNDDGSTNSWLDCQSHLMPGCCHLSDITYHLSLAITTGRSISIYQEGYPHSSATPTGDSENDMMKVLLVILTVTTQMQMKTPTLSYQSGEIDRCSFVLTTEIHMIAASIIYALFHLTMPWIILMIGRSIGIVWVSRNVKLQ
jgi:hypothetical protein